MPTASGSGHPPPPFTKFVGRLRLLAPPSYYCRQSQALGTFCALHSPKARDVSGSLHPHDENCRQSQALSAFPHENWETSQALCAPHDEHCRPFQVLSTPSAEIGGRLRLFAPHHKIADSFRLWALFVLSIHQKRATSQALCTAMMKIPDSFRL